jgi:hypothetical protein
MSQFPITQWRLDAQDEPNGSLVVRVIGQQDGREVVTPPIRRRLANWQVEVDSGYDNVMIAVVSVHDAALWFV